MAQVNRNLDYVITTDGLTVWEKLKNIRVFLDDRKRTYKKVELKRKYFDYNALTPEQQEEYNIDKEFNDGLLEDCKMEIEFLEELEQTLSKKAEETRIAGKTDKEMYEINFIEERIQRDLLSIKCDMLSLGRLSSETVQKLIQNPESLQRAVDTNLLPESTLNVQNLTDVPVLNYLREKQNNLLDYKKEN